MRAIILCLFLASCAQPGRPEAPKVQPMCLDCPAGEAGGACCEDECLARIGRPGVCPACAHLGQGCEP